MIALRLSVAPECDRADFTNEQRFAGFVHLEDNSAEFVGDESHRTMAEYESGTAAHSSEAVRLEFARIAASNPMFPLKLTPKIVTVAIRHSCGPGTVSAEIEGVQRFKTAQITWETCERPRSLQSSPMALAWSEARGNLVLYPFSYPGLRLLAPKSCVSRRYRLRRPP